MQEKSITSVAPAPAGMLKLAVVVLLVDSDIKTVVAVSSLARHAHPLAEVKPVAPFIVMTAVQVLAPRVNLPAVAPPVVEEMEHPDVVNFVPALTIPLMSGPVSAMQF